MSNLNDFRSGIKSIQRGVEVMATGAETATIAAVVMANSILIATFHTSNIGIQASVSAVLTNTTTITFTNNIGNSAECAWQIIEFHDQYFGATIKSLQRGTVLLAGAGGEQTDTIVSVDTTKSVLHMNYSMTGNNIDRIPHGVITNATTLTFATEVAAQGSTCTVVWQVIEYY